MADLEGVFEACVAQLNSGTPVDAYLALHPAESTELTPLLRIVVGLQALAQPAPAMEQDAAQAVRTRFLARASVLSRPAQTTAEEAFEQSIAMMAAGASLEDCLDRFPHHAAELRPMLQTLGNFQQVHQPAPAADATARSAARELFVARAAVLSQPPAVSVEDALDASLRMAAVGATVDQCVQAFPHYARELRPALAIAQALRTEVAQPAPARPAQAVAKQRQTFVKSAGAARRTARRQRSGASWRERWPGLFGQPAWARAAVLILVVLLVVGFGRVAATMASAALPGDTLYPIKLAAEQARLLVTPDEEQRATLREQFEQTRREEAAVVTEQGRQVQVQFPGVIDSMVDGVWLIAGLEMPVLVAGDSVVRGQPSVGAHVVILAYSDGSGSLVARQVLVLTPADVQPPTATPTSTPSRTPRPDPPVLAPLPPPAPAATWTPGARPTFTRTPTVSPTWTMTATATPSGTPSGTPTTTATPSGTATGTPTTTETPGPEPSPTWTPLPRPVTFFGTIQEMSSSQWQVSGRTVLIVAGTVIDESQGPAVIGANVQVDGMEQPDGAVVAITIRVQASAVDIETFTGIIYVMGGSQWLIGDRWVVVDVSTQIIGVPAVGKAATVTARRVSGGPWTATRIAVEEPAEPVYIEGVISEIGAGSWVVDGQRILITSNTVITGAPPQIGLSAQVEAIPTGGALVARFIYVIAATATPAPTWTPTTQPTLPTPTSTSEPPPTSTPTGPPAPTPIDTPTPTPIDTPTPAPPTATPVTTPTPAPTLPFPTPPTATPAATPAPAPTFPFPTPATATPVATPTSTPTLPFPLPSPPP